VARQPRDDAPGVGHHVMVRGIERRTIFADDRDREELLRRLSILMPQLGFLCFGWVLIPNHFHLLVRSAETRVSRLMARLGTGYARYFNERHDRVGHLFQNRFRSRRAEDEADLVGLIRYVCLNPLEAGLVRSPAELEAYPWCSAGALVGRRMPRPFEAVRETLALFDPDPGRARGRLRGWLGAPPEQSRAPLTPEADVTTPTRRCDTPGSLEAVVALACEEHGVGLEQLRSSRRRNARLAAARAAVASRASRELGVSGAEIARVLAVTPSAVTRMLSRAERRSIRGNEATSQ